MKRFSAAVLLSLTAWSAASAQTITVGAPQLTFGTATEVAPQTRTLTVSNPTAAPIAVAAQLFGTYGQPAFSVSPSTFTVAAGGSQTLTVTFAPLHNIAHNSELVLTTDHLGAVSVDLLGQGSYSLPYYNATQNLSEQALLTSLKTITTTGHHALGYNTGRDRMFMVIDNKRVNGQGATTNTLECIYTGRVITGFSSRSAAQGMNMNTEHTWPQSLFNSSDPMVSDLNHLFPTDNDANGSRSNYPFGVATTPYRNDAINAPSHLGNNTFYEPRDVQKGRTARAMMYFVTRYQNFGFFFGSQQNTLRKWHRQFPPTAADKRRCDDVLTAQGNRNPFSDYPQLVDRITNFIGNPSVQLDSVSLYQSSSVANFGSFRGTPVTYEVVVVNNGNETFTPGFHALNVVGGTVTMTSNPNFQPLAPGEALPLRFTLESLTGTALSGNFSLADASGIGATINVTFSATGTTGVPAALGLAGLSLNVYPNPAQGALTVVRHSANPGLTGVSAYDVTLLDGLGRAVRTVTATTDETTTLDLTGLPAGLYVVRAGSLSRRVVVQ